MSQQHQTGKHKVGIRLFKDLERFCVKAPFFDRFEWQVRDSFDLNDIPGSGYLIIFEQPNSNLMNCAGSILLEWRWCISNSTEPLACNQSASSNFILSTDGRMILTGDGRCSYSTLSEKSKVYSLWRAAAHTTLMWCDFGPHKSGPFSALGNTFVFRQSGERVVISHWHADSRVVLWQSKGRNPTSQGRNLSLTCRSQGRNPTFQGRNLSLTCRFQGRTFAV